jgi:phage terminase large subunit-like protein
MDWDTSCKDWERRIIEGEPLIPMDPLFPREAAAALEVFNDLRVRDVPGAPSLGECSRPWIQRFVSSIFGAYDAATGRRLIIEFFLSVAKKNSKALALSTPIPTPSGWTTMGAVQVGDIVFGADGKPCAVTATSEVFTDHDCFRVVFSNGESVVADAGHLWLTRALIDKPGTGRRDVDRRRLRVRTTQEIADTLVRLHDGARNHSIDMPQPIDCEAADLPVAPYTFGAWLGDGHSACAKITCHRDDREIIEGIEADGWPVRFASNNGSAADTYSISDGDRTQSARNESLASKLRQMGVLKNKHIPDAYCRGSFAQRLALLQGLMDTDGSISKNGRVLTYSGVNERLVRGVSELLSTFGVKSSIIERPVKCNGRPAGSAHFVQFMTFLDALPVFRLKRKLDRMIPSGQTKGSARSRTVQIVGAEKVPPVPVKCITVDAPDHLFLFGRSMLPTHNSTLAAGVMLTALVRNWRESAEFVILAPTVEVANNSFGPASDMIKMDPALSALMHVRPDLRTIRHRKTGAALKVVAANERTVSGKKATGTLIDELWQFGKVANAEGILLEATGGLASRPEGFVIYLTTQSDEPPAGVFKKKLSYARDVRDGKVADRRFLPLLYEYPQHYIVQGLHRDRRYFYIPNPNLGASVDVEYIERKFAEALINGEESMRGFLAKHANVEPDIALRSDRWSGADFWMAQADETLRDLDALMKRCDVVVVGIDGGGLDDLLGVAVLGRERETRRWLLWNHAFISPQGIQQRKSEASKYEDFRQAEELTIVDDLPDDLSGAVAIVERVYDAGLLGGVALDQGGLGQIVDELAKIGVTEDAGNLVGISQGPKLANSIRTMARKLADGTMLHAGQALMTWCVGNAKAEPKGNAVMITKQTAGTGKIDPLIAAFNASELMSRNPEAQGRRSFWETAARTPAAHGAA